MAIHIDKNLSIFKTYSLYFKKIIYKGRLEDPKMTLGWELDTRGFLVKLQE